MRARLVSTLGVLSELRSLLQVKLGDRAVGEWPKHLHPHRYIGMLLRIVSRLLLAGDTHIRAHSGSMPGESWPA
jgi:hypothetical protein